MTAARRTPGRGANVAPMNAASLDGAGQKTQKADLAELPGLAGPRGLQEFVAAASSLADTIARTSRIAEDTADLLRAASNVPTVIWRAGEPGFISLTDAAARTGRHPDVLRRWCADGTIPAIRVGRTWALSRETVAQLVSHSGRSRPRLDGQRRPANGQAVGKRKTSAP